ncbi:MAG: SPOR domain-containing protein, partial [Terracidiphilus sp.]
PMILLGVFFGLVLICGLCFGLGYAVGHHDTQNCAAAVQPPEVSEQEALPTGASRLKSSATATNSVAPVSQSSDVDQPSASNTNPVAASQAAPAGSPQTSPPQPVVKPALPSTEPVQSTSTGTTMVQIAAVSHMEDADVLVGALRKRGYEVRVDRDAADGQFHVRIGPFASRNEAGAVRQRLQDDGYNAVVQ